MKNKDGYRREGNLIDWLGRVLQGDDHLVLLPVVIGLVGQVNRQHYKSQANQNPQSPVNLEQASVKSVAKSMHCGIVGIIFGCLSKS